MIDRYTVNMHGNMVRDDNGPWCKYVEHQAIVDHWKDEASVAANETKRQHEAAIRENERIERRMGRILPEG